MTRGFNLQDLTLARRKLRLPPLARFSHEGVQDFFGDLRGDIDMALQRLAHRREQLSRR